VDDRSRTPSSHQSPDEEGNAGGRDKIRLHRKQVADLVHGEPDGWERDQPEDEERCVVGRRSSRAGRECVVDGVSIPTEPDTPDHEVHAMASNVGLNTVPESRQD